MPQSSLALYRKLPPTIRLLVAGTLINNLGTMIGPFLTVVMVQRFNLAPVRAGKVASAFLAGTFISVLIGGWLTDKIGRRRTLILSFFVSGILAIVLGCSSEINVFLKVLFLFGFFTDLYRPASASLLSDHLTSRQRSSGYAALRVAMNLGTGFAFAAGGLLMDWNWRSLFWFDGISTIAFGILTYKYILETKPIRRPDGIIPKESDLPPWKNPAFYLNCVVGAFLGIAFNAHMTILPLTITQAGHYSNKVFGCLLAVNGLMITLFEMSWVQAFSERRRLRVAAAGTAFVALGLGMAGLELHWVWFLITVMIWTVGEILTFSFLNSFIADLAPPHRRGQYLSLNQGCWRMFMSISPLILFPAYARLPVQIFWLIIPVMLIPAIWVLLLLDRRYDVPEKLIGLN